MTAKANKRIRRTLGATAFFVLVFAVAPLSVVAWKGGSNLTTRYQQWGALRISMQSMDPGRLAIDNPDEDKRIIASFLPPGPDREAEAATYYWQWVMNRDWWTVAGEMISVDYNETGDEAVVKLKITMKYEDDQHKREYIRTERWRLIDGIWYILDTQDKLTKEYYDPIRSYYVPKDAP